MTPTEEQIARDAFERQVMTKYPQLSLSALYRYPDDAELHGDYAGLYKRTGIATMWQGFLMGLEAKKLTNPFKVFIAEMTETGNRKTYFVTIDNLEQRPKEPKLMDQTGRITPFSSSEKEHALHEAFTWADFLGVEYTACTCVMCKYKGRRAIKESGMRLIRMHRGGLDESLKTQQSIPATIEDVREYIKLHTGTVSEAELATLTVELYENTPDTRIAGWPATWIVRYQYNGTDTRVVLGFINGPLDEMKEQA